MMKNLTDRFASYTVIVVGDVMLDVYFVGSVSRISPEAPVPIVNVKQKTTTLGGAGNVALNIRGLHCQCVLVGIRGNDAPGVLLDEILAQNDIVNQLVVDAGRSTTTKTRILGHGQQLLRLDEEHISSGSDSVQAKLYANFERVVDEADVVMLSDYSKGVVTSDLAKRIIGACRSRKIPVFVDPRGKDWERYSGATCITPNTGELEVVTGLSIGDDEELITSSASELISRLGLDWLLVTRGASGMCLLGSGESPLWIKSAAREVYDVSGAGDTVIATLAVGVAAGLPFQKAAEISNIAAGIVVGKIGSQPISLRELEAALHVDEASARAAGPWKMRTAGAARLQVKTWQAAGQKVVFAVDRFSVPDVGQIRMLQRAKELGDRLIVSVQVNERGVAHSSTDGVMSEHDREHFLAALECVDLIVPFHAGELPGILRLLQPDILIQNKKAEDSELGGEAIETYVGRIEKFDQS